MTKNLQIYGIKNCDTVKKALKWLQNNQIEADFHDFKKEELDKSLVKQWFEQIDHSVLINKRGTTWRKLSDADKNLTDESALIKLVIDNPSLVKRPVVLHKNQWYVGFKEDEWQQRYL